MARLTRREINAFLEQEIKELRRQIRQDPVERERLKDSIEANEKICRALAEQAGIEVESIDDLVHTSAPYPEAIPVLIRLLPEIEPINMKEAIVRALTVKEARGVADRPLIEEFKRIEVPGKEQEATEKGLSPLWHYKWAIGNALSVVAGQGVVDEVVALLRDKRHGGTRSMLAWALFRLRPPETVDLLMELLQDEDDGVAIQSALVLGRLRVKEARELIEKRFLGHPGSWFRQQAKRALAKLEKACERLV